MNELVIVDIAKDALRTALLVAGPALVVSMVVGLTISIFQVVTSLQDQTVAFVPKVVAVMATVVLCFPWMMRLLVGFTARMFTDFNHVVKALN
ncbi:flagellar biosynthesis protein FliQ [Mesoterricola sediminis]|uniref:Flagellar biosynthetic protein FliQ n=1 Tax=Mesoterricola sediminis TaxID=2927980 RepID=A0AA48KC28_9BACT|nr:flagellar biosynthesis protein FliQ [Mesoterricola sediminis]BDU76566.1 flagellar biosynthetic protein FliQ [Mesoterricola sediminis]